VKLSKKYILAKCFVLVMAFSLLPRNLVFASDGSASIEIEYSETATLVIIRYQDEFGNDLLSPYVLSQNEPGTLYIANHQVIPGYDLIKTIGSPVGFHGTSDVEILFIYRYRPTIIITSDAALVKAGDMITYTIIISNKGRGRIRDTYFIHLFTQQMTAPINALEFRLDYLEIGETVIEISMATDSYAATGSKEVTAHLIHPQNLNINDTLATTAVEITGMIPSESFISTPILPINPGTSEESDESEEVILEPEFENSDMLLNSEENPDEKQPDNQEHSISNQASTNHGLSHLEENEHLVEVVEKAGRMSLTMIGTFSYDLLLISAIGSKAMKIIV